MVNIEIVKKNIESFIMPFQIPTDICDELINYFKTTKYNKIDTTESGWSTDVKQGIDLTNAALKNWHSHNTPIFTSKTNKKQAGWTQDLGDKGQQDLTWLL